MDSDDIDRLEQRLREALAAGLVREADKDKAWARVRAGLAHRYKSDEPAQNGSSSSFWPIDDRDVEF